MAKISVFLDEDMHLSLGPALRNRGCVAQHAQELDRKGIVDREQLAYASRERNCLFTFNIKDFVLLHNAFMEQGREHWGIVVSRQLPISETLRRILQVLQRFSQEDMKNRLEFL